MKITILTIGTRGDVQPFAILGEALAKRGHQVTIAAAENFKKLICDYQLIYHPLNIDYEEIVNSTEGKKILNGNVFAIQKNFKKLICPLVEQVLDEFYQLAQCSDLLIYRSKTLADVFLNYVDCKIIKAAVIPAMEGTVAFSNPSMSGFRLPKFLNRWTYKLNNLRYFVLRTPIRNFFLRNGLERQHIMEISMPSIYGISPHFLARPDDWPSNHHLTGFWFSNRTAGLSPAVETFLKRGDAPILITFGSMPAKVDIVDFILQAERDLHQRFIIIAGWAQWNHPELAANQNILTLKSASYIDLLPNVKAVVHHGGIGTIAECLRAGKPMFICPVLYPLGDQSFWGDLAYKKGVAVKPVPLQQLTQPIFIKRMKQLIEEKNLYKHSRSMAEKVIAEDGVEKAADLVERFMLNDL